MSSRVILVELDIYSDVNTYRTLRFATRAYATKPTDTPASTIYEARLRAPLRIKREMFLNGGVRGATQTGFGTIEIANALGGTVGDLSSTIRTASVIERPARVLVGMDDAAYSTFALIYSGTVAQVSVNATTISFTLKDRQRTLESAHTLVTYAGNNSLPNGLEGVTDLEGKVKPIIYGKVFNISPPLVNTSRLIYQVHSGTVSALNAVYDGGVALPAGAAYSSQVDMETNAPSVGEYRLWSSSTGSYFRLGSSPVYQITADVTADTAGNSTTAQILKRMAIAAGIAAADISATDVTAVDALSTAVQGIYIDSEISTKDAMNAIAKGALAYFGFDLLGAMRMGVPTVGAPVMTISRNNAKDYEFTIDADNSFPTINSTVGYAKYWTRQQSGLAGSVSAAARSDLGEEYRVYQGAGSLSPNPFKRNNSVRLDTLLTTLADATTLAGRLITNTPPNLVTVKGVALTPAQAAALVVGCTVNLAWVAPYTATNLRTVYAIDLDFTRLSADITIDGLPV